MFHPLFVSLCLSIIYILFHSIPSSSSLTVPHYHNEASCYDLHFTASSEFSSFNTIPHSFFLRSQRTRMSHTCNIFISLLILLSADIQSNPGPVSRVSSLNVCTLTISSFTNPLHYTAIANLANTYNIDVFALSETWISPNTTSALVAAQHFFSVNLANFSPHPLLLLNPLNCLQSLANFLTLIWLYITSIVLLNLIPNIGILCLSLSF